MREYLTEVMEERLWSNFGHLYALMRAFWIGREDVGLDCAGMRSLFQDRWTKYRLGREAAIHAGLGRIVDPDIGPRRLWDLFSDRVVPIWQVPKKANIMPVSHVWLPETERIWVRTSINGERWPVPIPKHTTLERVRVELLNLGAEYAWLDVLCLRQRTPDTWFEFE